MPYNSPESTRHLLRGSIRHLQPRQVRLVNSPSAQQLREHQRRLEALWDLALSNESGAQTQLQMLLQDATEALECDYAELYALEDGSHVSAGSLRAEQILRSQERPEALGSAVAEIENPLMVYDTDEEAIWGAHRLVTGIPLRSVFVLPLEGCEQRHVLLLGWSTPRAGDFTGAESHYIDFLSRVIARVLDIAQKSREMASRIAMDPLTGLYNRAAMLDHIAVAVSSAERNGTPTALFYIDLDGFKEINDTHGHSFGDAALSETARRMRAALRKHEVAGRIGGDEFAVLVTSFSNEQQLLQIAQRILSAIGEPILAGRVTTKVGASIGIALYPRDGATAEDLLKHADAAMYRAKRLQDGEPVYFGTIEAPAAVRSLFGAQHAELAMDREFFLCYQPIVDARTGKPVAAEALLRWLHPGMGMLSPHAFLGASRDERMLPRIEEWVVKTALEKHAKLRKSGHAFAIHVNVSEPGDALLDLAAGTNLRIEIPEDEVAQNENKYVRFIEACRDRGIRTGLSNFGCGGLSLSVLAKLPLEFVKIGPALIPASPHGEDLSAAGALIETAHRFGWAVFAENIEQPWQREWLASKGVDSLQGYAVCSPLTETDFDHWLKLQNA